MSKKVFSFLFAFALCAALLIAPVGAYAGVVASQDTVEVDPGETDAGETDAGETDTGETDPSETDPSDPDPGVKGDVTKFIDLDKEGWYYGEVKTAVEKGLFNGTGKDTFEPNTNMNRAMFVTVLYRLAGSPEVTAESPFTDVVFDKEDAAKNWYYNAVIWAAQNKLIAGYGNGQFGPMDNVTRQDMVTILYRYAQFAKMDVTGEADLSVFTDAADITDYALPAMKWAVAGKIVKGMNNGTVAPKDLSTRAQVAAVFVRFLALAK